MASGQLPPSSSQPASGPDFLALRLLKAAFNADTDGLAGIQQLAGDATLLYYMSEEAQEGRNAYLERRRPRFDRFPKRP